MSRIATKGERTGQAFRAYSVGTSPSAGLSHHEAYPASPASGQGRPNAVANQAPRARTDRAA